MEQSSNPGTAATKPVASIRCERCGAANEPAPICAQCGNLLALPADVDHYRVLGLPPQLNVDREELERRYYSLSRLLHPDQHHRESTALQQIAMQNTAALTRAYRTLRDPVGRARYWLELHGDSIGTDNKSVPPALAAQVFEVQEEIEACRAADASERPGLARALQERLDELNAQREDFLQKLFRVFVEADSVSEATPALRRELKALLSSRAYLETLARDIGRALSELSPSPLQAASVAPSDLEHEGA